MLLYPAPYFGISRVVYYVGRQGSGCVSHLGDGKHGWHGGASGFIWKGFKLQGNICMHYDTTVVSVSSGCH